jgi:hypothetical protein
MTFAWNNPDIIVLDNFFINPDEVHSMALDLEYAEDLRYFKGQRSTTRHLWPYMREYLGYLIGTRVTAWTEHEANGVFQITGPDDPLVYHSDTQTWAGAVYLTPGDNEDAGTSFWRHAATGQRHEATGDFEDATRWDLIDTVAGVYNRLVLWRGDLVHSATGYPRERLVQLFFFDT